MLYLLNMNFFKIHALYKLTNIFFITYLLVFLIRSFKINNVEFVGYMFFFLTLFVLGNLFFDKYLKEYSGIYAFSSLFLLLHILGGVIYFGEVRMYDYYFFGFFRFDWFMHLLGGFLSGRISYEILKDNFLFRKNSSQLFIAIVIILSIGIGTLNEIIEFLAVIFLNAGNAVGDYYNNLTDIVNNLVGSVIYLAFFSKTLKFKETEFEKIKTHE